MRDQFLMQYEKNATEAHFMCCLTEISRLLLPLGVKRFPFQQALS